MMHTKYSYLWTADYEKKAMIGCVCMSGALSELP